jgi:PEGA domain
VPRDTTRVAESSPYGPNNRAVPRGERPRGDRPAYGTAVPRRFGPHGGGGGGYYPWSSPWWWDSYPYSFGFFAWDPFWWGASYPAYPAYPAYPGYQGYPAYAPPTAGYFYGSVRLKVKPREAEVYVDGYFAGRVDDYDGAFQHLNLATGPHHIQVQSPGYDPLEFDVNIQVDQNITYRGELQHQ